MSIRYSLTRSRRKTVSLRIAGDMTVDVRAPLNMPKHQIDAFVQKHESWIHTHLSQAAQELQERMAFQYRDGDRLPYRGGALTLGIGQGRSVSLQDNRLLIPPGMERPEAVAAFLREETRKITAARIEHYAPLMNVRPTGVKITSAASRWGSCSGRNSLCFTYRLACLPDELSDYIVVHELAHIRQHNHSVRFWAVVREILPDYEARRRLLREYQRKIVI